MRLTFVGLTARALATATGQHYTRVRKIEHGVQAPTNNDIREWCRACGSLWFLTNKRCELGLGRLEFKPGSSRGSAAWLVSWRHTCPQPVQR